MFQFDSLCRTHLIKHPQNSSLLSAHNDHQISISMIIYFTMLVFCKCEESTLNICSWIEPNGPGAHYPERPSPILSLRDNLCPDWAIFRIVSRERLSPLRSAYNQNQSWKKWRPKREAQSRILRPFSSTIFSLSWLQSHAAEGACLVVNE